MSTDTCTIEVNGVELEARPGQMLIEVTDAADIYIPRFCYHEKLSIAANCRMCLIEVENVPKPLPACATPVTAGMKVFTRSSRAIAAQRATMEFLLINHPLDCPICDQGGECELQDLAMGFGRGVSRYTERKRVVKDKDLGPLVSTDMTRCIHCTRCVRFGQEIAGIQELGTVGRGEDTEIGTYIEQSVDHELSGNIIDLCPVGALNNKPYRFSARAWEMSEHASVSPHDCLGSNLNLHVLGGVVKRVVPRVNEALNETWLADRDRFSCEGIYAGDRLESPMIRRDGALQPCSWDVALAAAADGLRGVDGNLGALVSPSATLEEGYLAGRLVRHLGSDSIDHRLRRRDFRQQESDPIYPWLGSSVAELEDRDAILIIGSNLRREVPLLGHRLRKAALNGARIGFVNPDAYEYLFPTVENLAAVDLVAALARLLRAVGDDTDATPAVGPLLEGVADPEDGHGRLAAVLTEAKAGSILLGQMAMRHPRFADLRVLAQALGRRTGATLGYISEGANAAGLSLAGVLPHRGAGGTPIARPGATATDMLRSAPQGLVLLGVEPDLDCANGEAGLATMQSAEFVLALTAFLGEGVKTHASVVLPIGTFAETAGTYVNAAGDWQSFAGAVAPFRECRPGWKVLRVLGNLVELPDCQYQSATDIHDELRQRIGAVAPNNDVGPDVAPEPVAISEADLEGLDVPMYRIDALVRRARSLQLTRDGLVDGEPLGDERRIA